MCVGSITVRHKDELLKLFCKACQKVICRDCALVKHREHDFVFVHEFRSKAQEELEGLVKNTREKLTEFSAHSDHLAKTRELNFAAFHASKQELNSVFDQLVKHIETRRKTLLADLEALSQSEEKWLNTETDFLETALARLTNSIQFTEKLLDSEDDVEMMLMSTQANLAFKNLQQLSWDREKVAVKLVRVIFNQKDLKRWESLVGFIGQPLKDHDVCISPLPLETSVSFSFNVSLTQEVSKLGLDFTPLLSVQVTDSKQVEVPVEIENEGLNKWKITCTPNEAWQHKVMVKIDSVVKERQIMIKPKPLSVGMKVVCGPDWEVYYKGEDGGAGAVGEVVKIKSNNKVDVKWPNGKTREYRWGQDNAYDLKVVN